MLLAIIGLAALPAAEEGPPGPRRWPLDLAAPGLLSRSCVVGRGVGVKDGVLSIDGIAHRGSTVFFDEPEAVPAAIRFEFRIADAGPGARGFGVIFSSRSSTEYLYLHLDRHRQAILVRSGPEEPWGEIARRGGLDYGTGEWHRVEVRLDAGRVEVEIDGRKALTASGVEAGPGRFGFYVSDGRAEVRGASFEGRPARLDPPWRDVRRPSRNVVVASDAGAGGYQAFPDVRLRSTGEMLCVFYAGFDHVSLPGFAPEGKLPPECPRCGRVCLVRSADLGRTWSGAEVVVDGPLDDRDPSIAELPDGTLLVTFFSLAPGPGGSGYRFVSSNLVRSRDGGRTWGEPERLFADWAVSSPVRLLSDGRLALPVYYVGEEKSPGGAHGGVSFSRDGGKSWPRPVPVGKDGPFALDAEPDLVELPGGRLLLALRPVMALSSSDDGGATWSRPADIGFAAHCPYFLRLRSGVLLLAHRLPGTSLHYSLDDGKSWSANVPIDPAGGAYPSLCELPPGKGFPEGTAFVVWYEEGPGSRILGRWLRADASGVSPVKPRED